MFNSFFLRSVTEAPLEILCNTVFSNQQTAGPDINMVHAAFVEMEIMTVQVATQLPLALVLLINI